MPVCQVPKSKELDILYHSRSDRPSPVSQIHVSTFLLSIPRYSFIILLKSGQFERQLARQRFDICKNNLTCHGVIYAPEQWMRRYGSARVSDLERPKYCGNVWLLDFEMFEQEGVIWCV